MCAALIGLAAVALAVIGLIGAGVIQSPYEATVLLLALVALHVLLRGRLLRALLVAAGVIGLVHAYGVQVLEPFLGLVAILFGYWVMFGGLVGRRSSDRRGT